MLAKFDTATLAKEKGYSTTTDRVFYPHEVIFSAHNRVYDKDFTWDTSFIKNSNWSGGFVFAPTQSQLQKWLRENHNIHIAINFSHSLGRYDYTVYASNEEALDAQLYKIDNDVEEWCKYTCYEDALEDALIEGLNKIPRDEAQY